MKKQATIIDNVKTEMDIITNKIKHDDEYAWAWHCNIAMSAFDEGVNIDKANKIASRFMYLAFKKDMYKTKYLESDNERE